MGKEDLGNGGVEASASSVSASHSKEIWRVRVGDGVTQYFTSKFEADFYHDDTAAAGFTVATSPVPIPQTPREFLQLMEQLEEERQEMRTTIKEVSARLARCLDAET